MAHCSAVHDAWLSFPSGLDPWSVGVPTPRRTVLTSLLHSEVANVVRGACGNAPLVLLESGAQYAALTASTISDCSCSIASWTLLWGGAC